MTTNRSEEFVQTVCKRSFLSLWSFANPKTRKGKELCDVLIVCDPDIVIFSVKEIEYKETGRETVDNDRWWKRAVDKSCNQLYGAEPYLANETVVIDSNGNAVFHLPEPAVRRIHRVSVSLGADRRMPIMSGDFGKGYIHIFDGIVFPLVLRELDTISDFIHYLLAKENLETPVIVQGGEEEILAFYLLQGKKLPDEANLIAVDEGLWNFHTSSEQYNRKKQAEKLSYQWDELIEIAGRDILRETSPHSNSLQDQEKVLRIMARETRLIRRILGEQFANSIMNRDKFRARIVRPDDRSRVYVFVNVNESNKTFIAQELLERCFVARGIVPGVTLAIGIAIERQNEMFRLLLACFEQEGWSSEDQSRLVLVQNKLDLFSQGELRSIHIEEYPD